MTKNQIQKNNNTKIKIADIKEFLQNNPKIFKDHPDLFEYIAPPSRSKENLIDIQEYMIESLQKNNLELKEKNSRLISLSEENQKSLSIIHKAVLTTLKAKSLNQLIGIILQKYNKLLELDYVNLFIEKTHKKNNFELGKTIESIDLNGIKLFSTENENIHISKVTKKTEFFFNSSPVKILSAVIMKIDIHENKQNLFIALGSKDINKFDENQGTELLEFFREILISTFLLWLK